VLDVVSGGRLDAGIGRGGTLQDYETFRCDQQDSRARVEEGVALIRECWGGRPFDFDGRFHSAAGWHWSARPLTCARASRQFIDATGYGRVLLLMAIPGLPTDLMAIPGLPTDLALRSMRLFMEE